MTYKYKYRPNRKKRYRVKSVLEKRARHRKKGQDSKLFRQGLKSKGCEICGYKKCIGALVFHHLDPATKSSKMAFTKGYSKILTEASKCMVVCSNCHAEIHAGLHPLISPVKEADDFNGAVVKQVSLFEGVG